ncbi:kinase-like domain-containing protein [Mycena rebaudengoi]|nr:kinase-like domain-containing protein [Mycena rebaudengoi]
MSTAYANYPHEQSDALKERFSFAKRALMDALGIEIESLEPIARGYNNKVYLLKILPASGAPSAPRALLPGCVPLPSPTPDYLIFRTGRHTSQVPASRKFLNAVACLQLIRENTDLPVAQPYSYDTSAAAEEDMWMVEGKLPGIAMDEVWETVDLAARAKMLESLADVLAKLKSLPVPKGSAYRFGGLTYNAEGKIALTANCLGFNETPFVTAKEYYKAWIVEHWEDAKKNPHTEGWKIDGLNERIEKFIAERLDSALQCLDNCEPLFIHADFTPQNLLISETAPHTVTGVLDFEWAHFGAPSDEFFLSRPAPASIHGGPYDTDGSLETFQALLSGNVPEPDPTADKEVFLAYTWDTLLKARGLPRFSTVPNLTEVARLYWFGEYLRPWFFEPSPAATSEAKMKKIQSTKMKSAICFDKDLKVWGY